MYEDMIKLKYGLPFLGENERVQTKECNRATGYFVINPSQFQKTKWANGQGATATIRQGRILGPNAKDTKDSYDWRLSLVDLKGISKYSIFENMQRWQVLLDGPGITLTDQDHAITNLDKLHQMIEFDGALAPMAETINGQAARVINFFARQDIVKAELSWCTLGNFPRSFKENIAEVLVVNCGDKPFSVTGIDGKANRVEPTGCLVLQEPSKGPHNLILENSDIMARLLLVKTYRA